MITTTNKTTAVIITSILFSASHLFNPSMSVFAFINIFLGGIWFAIARILSKTLWITIMLHVGWNYSLAYKYSFIVSGIKFENYQPGINLIFGPEWFTGGNFGPEGGLIGTIGIIIGALLTFYLLKKSDK